MVAVFVVTTLFLVCAVIALGVTVGVDARRNKPEGSKEASYQKGCVGKEDSYRYAAVASDSDICSTIGTDILAKQGGSAVDAAIATLLCLGLSNFHSAGIGGGFFTVVRHNQTILALDSREVAPKASFTDMYVSNPSTSSMGGLSIAVPGELAGYAELHRRFGRVPWKSLFMPSIKLCEEGVPVSPGLESALKMKESTIRDDSVLAAHFVNPTTGNLVKQGDKVLYPKLAATFRTIADEGADAFYRGRLAQDIVDDIRDRGGIITTDDLKNYQPKWRDPVASKLNDDLTLYSLPPPSSGALVMFILKLLDGFNFNDQTMRRKAGQVKFYQRFVEACKFAYARRAKLGDMDFVNITSLLSNLTSPKYADAIRSLITDGKTHPPDFYGRYGDKVEQQGTSHLSVLAPNGDAVSATSTINLYFGSKVLGSRTGIIFNDEMDDFSSPNLSNAFGFPPSPSNFIVPGKRPMSAMSPLILVDKAGQVKLVLGASGGSKIISSVAYVASRILMLDESLKNSIDAPRIHEQWIPEDIVYDKTFPKNILSSLKRKGYPLQELKGRGAVVQGIFSKDGRFFGYSDTRKGGCPDGY